MTTPLRCVVDASVCIKQFISDPLTPKVNQQFEHLANPQNEFFMKTFKEIKEILSQFKPIIQEKYKVKEMGIFGSYVALLGFSCKMYIYIHFVSWTSI